MSAKAEPSATPRAAPTRQRSLGLSFDRFTLKLAVGVSLLVIIPLAVGVHWMIRRHRETGIEARQQAATLEGRIIESALRYEMLEGRHGLLEAMLLDIASQPDVNGAMILNHDGEIRIASDPSLVGQVLSQDAPECYACHSKKPEDRHGSVLLDDAEGGVLRTVRPIVNSPRCQECHDAEQRVNGILVLDISMAGLQTELQRDVAWIAAAAAILAMLLFVGIGLFLRYLVLRRLDRLSQTARRIAAGNLSHRADIQGNDVITSVASDLNSMADSVSGLISEVHDQEAQLTSIMNSLDDGLVVLDPQSQIIACNHSFCRRMGLPPEDVRGRRCQDNEGGRLPCCQTGDDCPAAHCLATGRVQRAVFHVQNGDSEVARVEEVYASPVLGENGEVVQVVELWRDITERTKEEGRLAEVERMVSLGTLASGFSHEVNTPLASMLTCAEAVVSRIDESNGRETNGTMLPDIREHAETIRVQVMRCRDITQQFLRFSRGIPPSVEALDLQREVAEVVALVAPTAREAGLTLELEPGTHVPTVKTNTEVVRHVMLNLLVNAIQSFGDHGGSIQVRLLVGTDVAVQVSDTGCGIPPEMQGQIFDPLYSRKPQGTGLGLFLARSFMRRFGGDVELVSSEVGVGSCFQATFVRVPEPVA